jgi:hypothetical protein
MDPKPNVHSGDVSQESGCLETKQVQEEASQGTRDGSGGSASGGLTLPREIAGAGILRVEGSEGTVTEARSSRQGARVPLGEAFRLSGLDEWKVAQDMAGLVDSLKTQDEPKLLLEALKESSRCLENARNGGLQISLVHRVPRPRRQSTEGSATAPAVQNEQPEQLAE